MHSIKGLFLPIVNMKFKFYFSIGMAILFTANSAQAQNQVVSMKDLTGRLAEEVNAITTMVPFLTITPDSRSAAMGDAGAALFNPDANSVSWNMSNLVFANKKNGFSLSYAPWLRQLVDDVGFSYLSGYGKSGAK